MVRIITDSAADFEPQELQRLQVSCIPLSVIFGDREYRENIDLNKEQFYQLLSQADKLPTTAQPSPQMVLELFEEAKEAGEEALYITISSAISGTYQSACMAQNMAEYDGCYVVDSRSATAGQRLLVEEAVRLRDQGLGAAEIAQQLEQLRSLVTIFACLDTLENLYRGGRISQTSYAIGNLAQIKPIIHLDAEGKVTVPAKAMGTRKGLDMLCKKLEQIPMDPDYPLYTVYTSHRADGEAFAQRLLELGHPASSERVVRVGAAIGTHVGSHTVGIVYIRK